MRPATTPTHIKKLSRKTGNVLRGNQCSFDTLSMAGIILTRFFLAFTHLSDFSTYINIFLHISLAFEVKKIYISVEYRKGAVWKKRSQQ